jgi:NAD(P)-dependent dehydrogenase (short-subunit alcohol dehydrogenase family)
MTTLSGKTVLLTGAGGGLGQEMTRQFLRAGSHLILSDLNTADLPRTAAGVTDARGHIIGHVAADLSQAAGADALFAQATALVPAVDILVMNAGIVVSGRITDIPRHEWERLIAVDLLAPMYLTASFLPGMIERRRGHLIYISSTAGLIGAPRGSAYCAAKFGLRGFAEAITAEVKSYGVAVTVLYPFFTRTPMLESPYYGERPPARRPLLPPALRKNAIAEPEIVIAALLAGIRRRKVHVYPGVIPRVIDTTRRLAPWALPLLLTDRSPRAESGVFYRASTGAGGE